MKYKTIHFSSIDSTNLYLKEHYRELDNFTFVSTDYQSQGKGREDRRWVANIGENLLFSLLVKNRSIINDGPFISLIATVSVSEVLEKYNLSNIQIKWPNDVYANDAKIAGILLEGRIPEYLIIGIGLNVNQKEFIGEYRKKPTSMFLETNKQIDINQLKEALYQTIVENLSQYSSNKEMFLKCYKKHDYLLNKDVKFVYNNNIVSGIVKGVDKDFNIIIQTKEDELHISSGEIELIK